MDADTKCCVCGKVKTDNNLENFKRLREGGYVCLQCIYDNYQRFKDKYVKEELGGKSRISKCESCGKNLTSSKVVTSRYAWDKESDPEGRHAKHERISLCCDCSRGYRAKLPPYEARFQNLWREYKEARDNKDLNRVVAIFFAFWRKDGYRRSKLSYRTKRILRDIVVEDLYGYIFFKKLFRFIKTQFTHRRFTKKIRRKVSSMMMSFLARLRFRVKNNIASENQALVFYEISFKRSQASLRKFRDFCDKLDSAQLAFVLKSQILNPIYAGYKAESKLTFSQLAILRGLYPIVRRLIVLEFYFKYFYQLVYIRKYTPRIRHNL